MSEPKTVSLPIPVTIAVGVINQIEARGNALQIVVAGSKADPCKVVLELWEDGNPLPHTITLNDAGIWEMRTEVMV